MEYTIKVFARLVNTQPRLLTECTKKQQRSAFTHARSLVKKHKPSCHPNIGLTMAVIYDGQGKSLGGYKMWRDGEMKEFKGKEQ